MVFHEDRGEGTVEVAVHPDEETVSSFTPEQVVAVAQLGERCERHYGRPQDMEFALAKSAGYGAVTHQKFVGTGWFDALQETISGGKSATTALGESTEKQQF